jgi:hypothetical protein
VVEGCALLDWIGGNAELVCRHPLVDTEVQIDTSSVWQKIIRADATPRTLETAASRVLRLLPTGKRMTSTAVRIASGGKPYWSAREFGAPSAHPFLFESMVSSHVSQERRKDWGGGRRCGRPFPLTKHRSSPLKFLSRNLS